MPATKPFLMLLVVSLTLLPAASARAADGKVEGNVTVQGKPLATGRILFHLGNGQFVGSSIKDGKYTVDRVPTGTRTITVEGKGVPAKYAAEITSGLSVEIKKGSAIFDVALQQ